MDHTQSPDNVLHGGTGHRMHDLSGPTPTQVTDKDMNSLIWSLMVILNAAGVAGVQFDPGVPGSYDRVLVALRKLFLGNLMDVSNKDASGADRLFFGTGAATVIRGYGADPIAFANAASSLIAVLHGNGRLTLGADATSALDAVTLQQLTTAVAGLVGTSSFTGGNQSLASNGFQRLPGGTIFQWGYLADHQGTITFPIAFPNACLNAQLTFKTPAGYQTAKCQTPVVTAFDTTSLTTSFTDIASVVTDGTFWFATGH